MVWWSCCDMLFSMENICFLFTRFNQYSHNFLQTIENQTRTLSYKNKVPSFFFGIIYFNKFSANAFLLVFFIQILMIVKRNFFSEYKDLIQIKEETRKVYIFLKVKLFSFLQFLLLVWIFQKNEIRYELFEQIYYIVL
jgi:uncharacterized membrane protein